MQYFAYLFGSSKWWVLGNIAGVKLSSNVSLQDLFGPDLVYNH